MAKYNPITKTLDTKDESAFGYDVVKASNGKFKVLNGEGDVVHIANSSLEAKKWCKEHKTSSHWDAQSKWDWNKKFGVHANDANYPDVHYTAKYLWTWIGQPQGVSFGIAQEAIDKVVKRVGDPKGKRDEIINEAMTIANKALKDYYNQLSREVNKILKDGLKQQQDAIVDYLERLK